ncbi:hypothetical protein L226DRAFT_50313 [Lentinus tigrinus ALCF2SS1-7]|uniref:uncharacterized protein n=1 Tax=Lentinus tigrinus ALCF2SS1-7 TaxID=1328758 RepID=UPI001166330A|nr:hypothetical protein L226DRAFT_50313 [Lentinus tigrinus ALCF2SS1-7]
MQTEPLGDLPFQDFRSLHHLVFQCHSPAQDWRAISRQLLALPSDSRIHHLTFNLWSKTSQSPDSTLWDELQPVTMEDDGLEVLEEILQGDRGGDLESVTFAVGGLINHSEFEIADAKARILGLVQRKLPNVAQRGIISVIWEGP